MKKTEIYLGESHVAPGIGVYLEVELTVNGFGEKRDIDLNPVSEGLVLSISGHEAHLSIPSDWLSCGQTKDALLEHFPGNEKVQRLVEIWDRYHMNDMVPGTRAQMEILSRGESKGYEEAMALLEESDLLVDRGYKYGSAWLYEAIPGEVAEEIRHLILDLSRDEPEPIWKQAGLEMRWQFDDLRSTNMFVYQVTLTRKDRVMGPFQYSKGIAHAKIVGKGLSSTSGQLITNNTFVEKYKDKEPKAEIQKYLMRHRLSTVEHIRSLAKRENLTIIPVPPSIEEVLTCIRRRPGFR